MWVRTQNGFYHFAGAEVGEDGLYLMVPGGATGGIRIPTDQPKELLRVIVGYVINDLPYLDLRRPLDELRAVLDEIDKLGEELEKQQRRGEIDSERAERLRETVVEAVSRWFQEW